MRNRNAAPFDRLTAPGMAGGFTLIELLVVIAIILTLAGMLVAAAEYAKVRAKTESSRSIVHVLAAACDEYWAIYHDYPYHRPEIVGSGANVLAANANFFSNYDNGTFSGGARRWKEPAYTVTLVYMLSVLRNPETFLNINQKWFEMVTPPAAGITGPDGRRLFACKDGFGKDLKVSYGYITGVDPVTKQQTVVDRPWESGTGGGGYGNTTMRITSAGRDGQFSGTDAKGKNYADDNIEVFLQR